MDVCFDKPLDVMEAAMQVRQCRIACLPWKVLVECCRGSHFLSMYVVFNACRFGV